MGHEHATGEHPDAAFEPVDRTTMREDGNFLVADSGRRYLDLGRVIESMPADLAESEREQQSRYGERFRAAFAAECAAQDVQGELAGELAALAIEFAGQENASPELMRSAFLDELRATNVIGSPVLYLPPRLSAAEADLAEAALRTSVQRLRTLLVEHNSYLTGGLRYPFPPSARGVAERGLAIYRFPKTGNVDVTAIGDRIRIEFAPGDVGPITSSGFYIPTLIGGDFAFEACYEIDTWQPDAIEPACFALFVQNEASSRRYYAQRMSAGSAPHQLVASTVEVITDPVPVTGARGAFRLRRVADEIHFEHREDWHESAPWTALGAAPAPPEPEVILGAKIWTKLRCQGLSVEICNLRIDGRMAERQVPPVPVVKDPRSETPPHP